jgi:hypothetical protein
MDVLALYQRKTSRMLVAIPLKICWLIRHVVFLRALPWIPPQCGLAGMAGSAAGQLPKILPLLLAARDGNLKSEAGICIRGKERPLEFALKEFNLSA